MMERGAAEKGGGGGSSHQVRHETKDGDNVGWARDRGVALTEEEKGLDVLLSRTRAGPKGTVKQEQEETFVIKKKSLFLAL